MKRSVFGILMMCICFKSYTQELKKGAAFGGNEKFKSHVVYRIPMGSITYKDENGVYTQREDKYNYVFNSFSNALDYQTEIKHPVQFDIDFEVSLDGIKLKKPTGIIRKVKFQGKNYALVRSSGLLGGNKWEISMVPFENGKLNFDNRSILITKDDDFYKGSARIHKKIYSSVSNDGSKLAIGFTVKSELVDNANLGVVVVGENLKPIKKGYMKFDYMEPIELKGIEIVTDNHMDIIQFAVDNNGAIFTMGQILLKEKIGKFYPKVYSLFKYDFEKVVEARIMDVPNYYERDAQFFINEDNSINVIGTYSERGGYKYVQLIDTRSNDRIGTFFQRFDSKNLELLEENYQLFDVDLLAKFEKKPDKIKKKISKKGIEDYGLPFKYVNFKRCDDGTYVAVYITDGYYYSDNDKKRETPIYYTSGVDVCFLNSKGIMTDRKKVFLNHNMKKKRIRAWGTNYYVTSNGEVYIFTNDCVKNINRNDSKVKRYNGGKKSHFVMIKVKADANIEKVVLHDNKKNKTIPFANTVRVLDNKMFVFLPLKKHKFQLAEYNLN